MPTAAAPRGILVPMRNGSGPQPPDASMEVREPGSPPVPPPDLPGGPRSDAPREGEGDDEGEGDGATARTGGRSPIHVLTIVGQIEGHVSLPSQNKTTRYEHVLPQLVAIEQDPDVEGLLVLLNTVGGDVEAGLAIAEMIRSMTKPSASIVLGGGHSIGVPIAVAVDRSFIVATATMTIHPIRLNGLVIGVPQSFEYLEKMQERVTKFITAHSRITEPMLRELMLKTGELARDIGTTVVGRDAVAYGLIDEIGGLGQAMAKLRRQIEERRARREGGPLIDPVVGGASRVRI